MSCDVGKVTERLENELCYDYNYELCSFSNLSVTLPSLQLILQTFRRFTYITAHSPTLPLLHLRHSSFSNPSFASPTSQVLHLIHLASRPWLGQIFLISEFSASNSEAIMLRTEWNVRLGFILNWQVFTVMASISRKHPSCQLNSDLVEWQQKSSMDLSSNPWRLLN